MLKRFAIFLILFISTVEAKDLKKGKLQGWQPHLPKVVVTVKPIHSLIASIMEGIAVPELLIQDNTSPHGHALKPSEAEMLDKSEVIVWVGACYETSMEPQLKALESQKIIINLSKAKHVHLYPLRKGKFWGTACCHENEDAEGEETTHNHSEDHHHATPQKDGHLWLAANNAKAIVTEVTETLKTLDPQHAPNYMANSKKVIARLDDLAREITEVVRPIKGKPYMTMHDFSQYFDRFYGTTGVGTVLDGAHKEPTPQTVRKIEAKLNEGQAKCLFVEPQLKSKITEMLIENSGIRSQEVDYLGAGLDPGLDCYFQTMRRLANNMVSCLE